MNFLVTLLTIISFSATANVGDSITHTFNLNGQTGSQEQNVSNYNAETQEYTVTDITNFAGYTQRNINIVPAEDLFTELKASQILAYCTQIGGVKEVVLGLDTCKVSGNELYELGLFSLATPFNNAYFIWFGNVPVNGIVKAELSNGVTTTVSKYNWSK